MLDWRCISGDHWINKSLFTISFHIFLLDEMNSTMSTIVIVIMVMMVLIETGGLGGNAKFFKSDSL